MSKKRRHKSRIRSTTGKRQESTVKPDRRLTAQRGSRIWLLVVLLFVVCAAVVLVHRPVLSAKAMCFDDEQYLVHNLLVKNPGWTSARRFMTEVLEPSTVGGYYQPLSMLSLMLDYALGGRVDNLRTFHRTSLVLHTANTALVSVLLYLLFGRAWVAAGVGLLFGLHPMTVETIAWVAERKTLVSSFFGLWSLVLYVVFARRGRKGFYFGCVVMYVLALLSKPTSLPVPLLMLLLDFWPLRRLNKRAFIEKAPLFILGGVFAVLTVISQGSTADIVAPTHYSVGRVPLIISHNIIFYLYKIVWPATLSSNYTFPEPLGLSNPTVLICFIGSGILIVFLIVSLRWTRAALTGWLIFFVGLLPTMQILQFSNVIASDKFAYLPSIGVLIAFGWFLRRLCYGGTVTGRRGRHIIAAAIILILAGAEAFATRRYISKWDNTVSLYEHMLTVTPKAPWLYYDLGNALVKKGEIDEAIIQYRKALENKPDYVAAHFNLANTLRSHGKSDEAISHYQEAIKHCNVILRIRAGEPATVAHLVKAHNNLGNVLSAQGKSAEAIRQFREALNVKADYAEGHSNLGWELRMAGRPGEAVKHFEQAMRIEPNLLPPLIGMVQILTTHPDPNIRDVNKAVEVAERAANLTKYQDIAVLEPLAAAYASAGRLKQAMQSIEQAIRLADGMHDVGRANQLRRHLEHYRQAQH